MLCNIKAQNRLEDIRVSPKTAVGKATSSQTAPIRDGEVIIHYDGVNVGGVGTDSVATFTAAVRLTNDELADYYNAFEITKVQFYIRGTEATNTTIKIYGNGTNTTAGELLVSEPTSAPQEGWNTHTLTNPLLLESGDYWVGYEVVTTGGFPVGKDANTTVAGKGAWIYFEEDGWNEITAISLSGNFNIRTVISPKDGAPCIPVTNVQTTVNESNITITWNPPANENPRTYTITRNGNEIATGATETTYTDNDLSAGTYSYCVKAVYSECTSVPACAEIVTIGGTTIFYPATNIQGIAEGSNVKLSWNAPEASDGEIILQESFEGYPNGEETQPPGWIVHATPDEDGDRWVTIDLNYIEWITTWHDGPGAMGSYSWAVWPIDPDTYLVTPPIDGATRIKYYVATRTQYPDHYSLMVSKTGTNPEDFVAIFDETPVPEKDNTEQDKNSYDKTVVWFKRVIELPIGTKHVAFRHHDSYDRNIILIDDVTAYSGAPLGDYTYTVTRNGAEIASGLTETAFMDTYVPGGTNEYCVKVVYKEGTSEPACTSITGINENMIGKIKVYPNPAKDNLTIECPEEISKVEMFDVLGRIALSNENVSNATVDISSLNNGVYFLIIHTASGNGEYRIIKQ